ncbi:flagellar assembly protein FliH [Shewanella aestuarii]|uniref:Flagellar assembly protein FliH n=1 Tax=Shewanella aestuarii TaxID=1028752 RepID=A0A6G9QIU6_9GAMM|nr:flagellar assembly protein FliH [Shewanella aestuarii]QIR13987.1 flagellar assembly protein FliH [Shewanella aestuarii]
MTTLKHTNKVLSAEDEHEFSHWQLPDVTEDKSQSPSNFFGHKAQAYHASEPAEEAVPSMPTMSQLEDIRAAAEQEGFEQGKQEGLQQGLEQGRLDGLAQGHSEGFAQGEQQGYEAGLAKANAMIAQFTQLIKHFEQPLSVLDAEVEAEILAMTLTLAKGVIQQELTQNPQHIATIIRKGIDALPLKEQVVKLRLHPDDVKVVEELYGEAQLAKNDWHLESDPSLVVGDVYIESLRSTVDLRVSNRVEQVFSALDAQSEQLSRQVHHTKTANSQYQTLAVDDLTEARQQLNQQTQNSLPNQQTLVENDLPESVAESNLAESDPNEATQSQLSSQQSQAHKGLEQGEADDKPSTSTAE